MVGLNILLLSTPVYVYLSSVIGVLYPLFYKSYTIVLGHEKAIGRESGGGVFSGLWHHRESNDRAKVISLFNSC